MEVWGHYQACRVWLGHLWTVLLGSWADSRQLLTLGVIWEERGQGVHSTPVAEFPTLFMASLHDTLSLPPPPLCHLVSLSNNVMPVTVNPEAAHGSHVIAAHVMCTHTYIFRTTAFVLKPIKAIFRSSVALDPLHHCSPH